MQAEKYKRLETHPMNKKKYKSQISTESGAAASNTFQNENQDIISKNPEEWEILTPYTR